MLIHWSEQFKMKNSVTLANFLMISSSPFPEQTLAILINYAYGRSTDDAYACSTICPLAPPAPLPDLADALSAGVDRHHGNLQRA